jgi:hypothetical protein
VTRARSSSGSLAYHRQLVARGGQTILFVLTLLLAGMLLSQLIEEKSNKVIEILAAAVPIDADLPWQTIRHAGDVAGRDHRVDRRRGGRDCLLGRRGPRRIASSGGRLADFHCTDAGLFRDELSAYRRRVPRHRRAGLDGA